MPVPNRKKSKDGERPRILKHVEVDAINNEYVKLKAEFIAECNAKDQALLSVRPTSVAFSSEEAQRKSPLRIIAEQDSARFGII